MDLPQLCQHSQELSDARLSKSRLLNVAFILIVPTLLWLTVPQDIDQRGYEYHMRPSRFG